MPRAAFALALSAALATGASASAASQPAPARPAPATAAASRIRYPGPAYSQIVLPDGSRREIRSLLNVPRPMSYGGYVWDEAGVPPGEIWIRVDVGAQLISVFRGKDEIGTAVILYGANAKPTPTGAFHVLQKAKDYRSRTYDAPMPYMLRLTQDGVAIHASSVREGWATHGCIGVPAAFAQRLFAEAALGDLVVVVRSQSRG